MNASSNKQLDSSSRSERARRSFSVSVWPDRLCAVALHLRSPDPNYIMEGSPASPAVELRNWLESMADPMKEPWSDWEDDDRDDYESELVVDKDRSGVVIDPTVGFRTRTDLADQSTAKSRKADERSDDDDDDGGHADGDGDETEDYSDDARSCDSGFTSSMDGAGK